MPEAKFSMEVGPPRTGLGLILLFSQLVAFFL